MSSLGVVLAAHGTRDRRGIAVWEGIAEQVAAVAGVPVRLSFADVAAPTVVDGLRNMDVDEAVVIPAFLASGYHVGVDLPCQIAAVDAAAVPPSRLTPALGPDRVIAAVQSTRLREAGWSPGDAVVMAAVGSSDPHAVREVRRAARFLAAELRAPVRVALCTDGPDSVAMAVRTARLRSARRVAVSAYVLADGYFWSRIAACGADVIARPIGPDPALARLLVRRIREVIPKTSGQTVRY